jgi:hypothetical protein
MVSKSKIIPAVALFGALVAAPACATGGYAYRSDGQHQPYGNGREVERIAHDNGYHEGREAGENDGRKGRSFSVERHDDFRDADEGYHREYGDKDFYRREFREGFRAGYSDAYNQFAHYRR